MGSSLVYVDIISTIIIIVIIAIIANKLMMAYDSDNLDLHHHHHYHQQLQLIYDGLMVGFILIIGFINKDIVCDMSSCQAMRLPGTKSGARSCRYRRGPPECA